MQGASPRGGGGCIAYYTQRAHGGLAFTQCCHNSASVSHVRARGVTLRFSDSRRPNTTGGSPVPGAAPRSEPAPRRAWAHSVVADSSPGALRLNGRKRNRSGVRSVSMRRTASMRGRRLGEKAGLSTMKGLEVEINV